MVYGYSYVLYVMTGGSNIKDNASDATIRLQVYLARSGVCSRRSAAVLIEQGDVYVNGILTKTPGHRVNPDVDDVVCNGTRCIIKKRFVYYTLHKPIAIESTNKNTDSNKKTCRDFLYPMYREHLFSVGRLDYYTSGVMIYTNDGILCHRLTHPRYQIPKQYHVVARCQIPEYMLQAWRDGVYINGVRYALKTYILQSDTMVDLVLTEGKNREIRNVFTYYDISIKTLIRTACGTVTLKNIAVGSVRKLSLYEIQTLYHSVDLQIP